MFVWAPIPEPWRSRMSTMDFAMMLLEKGNVAVSPGSGFGPAGEGFLRMSLVENEDRLRAGRAADQGLPPRGGSRVQVAAGRPAGSVGRAVSGIGSACHWRPASGRSESAGRVSTRRGEWHPSSTIVEKLLDAAVITVIQL